MKQIELWAKEDLYCDDPSFENIQIEMYKRGFEKAKEELLKLTSRCNSIYTTSNISEYEYIEIKYRHFKNLGLQEI